MRYNIYRSIYIPLLTQILCIPLCVVGKMLEDSIVILYRKIVFKHKCLHDDSTATDESETDSDTSISLYDLVSYLTQSLKDTLQVEIGLDGFMAVSTNVRPWKNITSKHTIIIWRIYHEI